MDETSLIRRQLLDDLTARFESITCQLRADPTLTTADAGALISAACREFNAAWEELLTSPAPSRSRLKLVVRSEAHEE
jgi:hypothetical protein